MEIVPLDVYDDAAAAAWHATYAAADRHGRDGFASTWSLPQLVANWRMDLQDRWVGAWSGVVDGVVVTVGELHLRLLDNLESASVEVYTHPEHRRRGHGSAMLAHLEAEAKERGRSRLTADTSYPYESPADGAGHPHAEFLTGHGFTYALGDVQRQLDLPVPDDTLVRLAVEVAPHHAAYALRAFAGRAPDDLAEAYAALMATLVTEAPTGELDIEPETPDVAVLREHEELLARQGRTRYTTVALAGDGELAGYTELVTSAGEPGRVYQWGTLVPTAHRGHRLGLALKVANLAFLQREVPEAQRIVTWNAEVNRHMIGVNELLGFRPVERQGEFQKKLPV